MLGAGTVINPIIKVVTTVAILAAVYLFIVKPTLDTTNEVVNQSFGAFDESLEGFNRLPNSIQGEIDRAIEQTGGSDRLQECIQRALDETPPDTKRVNRCVERFTP